MDNDKGERGSAGPAGRDSSVSDTAIRARNRTVMLTPEMTGQVRARLAQEMGKEVPALPGGANDPGVEDAGQIQQRPNPANRTIPVPPMSAKSESHGGYLGGSTPPPASIPQRVAPIPEEQVYRGSVGGGRDQAHSAPHHGGSSPGIVWTKPSPLIGFLVSFDKDVNGEFYVLRVGRLIVSSEKVAVGNYLLIEDSTVSPMHAIIRISPKGEVQVLDQLSEHGTNIRKVNATEDHILSGDKADLGHGDSIAFGERKFVLCLLHKVEKVKEAPLDGGSSIEHDSE